ncbi:MULTISPECIES: ABC transporter ATP-binding protein [Streptomyces]|uniref:ABC transporter ATP-binding protein n=1 Tax=Streptomyces venezuelae TaxID=54571 RepID=A0A5P2B695_STRVZ|nr:ATP-binding cassette domain-containing protein [Streptomyces venezuelae]QES24721.1 ABC transporter ATP-binding protein [Streptomyces venezuelae]
MVLSIRGLTYEVPGRSLFSALDLDVRAGESVAVMGPSGSGKSTLLSCALGLVRPSGGTVEVGGVDMAALRGKVLAQHRARHIGMVFQFGELLPELSPTDNVALAALLAGAARKDAYRRAGELLTQLGVPLSETSEELSGGERQRAAVARAVINSPTLLLADEPTGALDEEAKEKVADTLFDMPRRYDCGLLLVTHDPAVAGRADRTLTLTGGVLTPVQEGWAAER